MSDPVAPALMQPPRTKRGSWVLRVVVAAAAIAVVVWFLRSRQQERTVSSSNAASGARSGGERGGRGGGAGGEGRVVPVQVATVERRDLPIWLEGLGTVAASQQVTVRPQVDGRIDKVLFTEGQPVKRGEVLIQIDPRPFLVTLHQAQGALARDRAQLETLQANLKRYLGLQQQNLVAGQQVEEIAGQVGQLEGSVKIDQAQIESAQLQLDYAQVKAPLDGIAGVRQVDAGNIIRQSDANGIVVITAIDPAAVFFTVPQDALGSVAQALARGEVAVEVLNRDGGTRLATGKLTVLDNQINQATATLRLKAMVPNPQRLLWPNAFVKARMLVETRSGALVIPTVAVQRGPQGTYVYAVGEDKTATMKPITIALTTGDLTVVATGLAGGEHVIIEGQNQVRPGGRVEPSRGPGGAPAERGQARGARGSGAGSQAAPEAGAPAEPAGTPARGQTPAAPTSAAPANPPPASAVPAAGARPAAGGGARRPTTGQLRPANGPTASNQPPAAP